MSLSGSRTGSFEERGEMKASCLLLTSVLLLAGLFLQGGCGKSEVPPDPMAMEYLDALQSSMSAVETYRMEGTMKIDSGVGEGTIEGRFTAEYETGGNTKKVHMISEGMAEEKIEGYIIEDLIYIKLSDDKWVCTDYDPVTAFKSNTINFYTDPESLEMMLDKAEKIGIEEEDSYSVTCFVELGKAYYRAVLQQMRDYVLEKELEGYDEALEDTEMSIKNMQTRLEITISKETSLPSAFRFAGRSDVPSYKGYAGFTVFIEGEASFRDYGVELDLRLPNEAIDAEYIAPKKKNI